MKKLQYYGDKLKSGGGRSWRSPWILNSYHYHNLLHFPRYKSRKLVIGMTIEGNYGGIKLVLLRFFKLLLKISRTQLNRSWHHILSVAKARYSSAHLFFLSSSCFCSRVIIMSFIFPVLPFLVATTITRCVYMLFKIGNKWEIYFYFLFLVLETTDKLVVEDILWSIIHTIIIYIHLFFNHCFSFEKCSQ